MLLPTIAFAEVASLRNALLAEWGISPEHKEHTNDRECHNNNNGQNIDSKKSCQNINSGESYPDINNGEYLADRVSLEYWKEGISPGHQEQRFCPVGWYGIPRCVWGLGLCYMAVFFGSLWHQREVFTLHGRDGSEVGRSL